MSKKKIDDMKVLKYLIKQGRDDLGLKIIDMANDLDVDEKELEHLINSMIGDEMRGEIIYEEYGSPVLYLDYLSDDLNSEEYETLEELQVSLDWFLYEDEEDFGYEVDDSSVSRLELIEANLKRLPDSIGKLKKLKDLVLSSNELSDLPDSIGYLEYLESLMLGGNNLKKLPNSIGQLNSLIFLDLSENQLEHLPDYFGRLKNLEVLDLSSNNLKELPESFKDLSKLKELNLKNNKFTSIPRIYWEMDSLKNKFINMEGNPLNDKDLKLMNEQNAKLF